MTNVKFPRIEIEKNFKLSEENIEKINLLGAPLESINDEEIVIDVLPNRPDLLSMQGWLRAFKAFLGKEQGLKNYKINKPEKDFKVKIDSSLKDIRPFTACAIVKKLNFDDQKIKEIIDIQEKLHATVGRNRKKLAIGIYPLEKIKLPITFKALKPSEIKFVPLESEHEMTAKEILQDHPTGKEYATILQGLEKYPVFLDANNKILSMPPIINSHETGKITSQTKEVFIECSGFDFFILKKTLNIIVTTLADLGGEIYAMDLEYQKKETTPDLTPEKIKISLENANKLLGLELKEKDIERLLPRMGYNYKNKIAEIPSWRTDILHEVDVIEDIAIAYGYNKIEPQNPGISTIGEESSESRIKTKIAEILTGINLLEISTYHLIKLEEAKIMKSEKILEVLDSKSEYKVLRNSLTTPAMRILAENKDAEYPQKIFEIGTVFIKDEKEETGVREEDHLLIALTPSGFTDIKQIIDYLSKMLGIKHTLQEGTSVECAPGRTAQVLLNNAPIGHFGEIHPAVLRNWGLKMPVTILEISLQEIYNCL